MIAAVTLEQLAAATGGVLRACESPADIGVTGLAIDSRAVQAGDCFVAIPGERVDGHDYVAVAAANGAAAALVLKPVDAPIPQLIVNDPEAAAAAFGRLARDQYDGVLVGITGSAGKTTAKNLIAAALAEAGNVIATEGNRNNELGVPLTLASLTPATEFAVLEMGAGKPGDIAHLQSIARPTIGVLLNVAEAHVAQFGSLDAIAETKGAILDNLSEQGLAIINGEQRWTDAWRRRAGTARVVTFGFDEGVDYRATDIALDGFKGSHFTVCTPEGNFPVSLNLPGRQGVINAVVAFAVADCLGVSPAAIARGLAKVGPAAGRGRLESLPCGALLVDDSYNANPMAVRAAIDVLASVSGPSRLVLGAMLELGSDAARLHAEVGAYAKSCGVDQLWVVGELAKPAADAFGSKARFFPNLDALMTADPGFMADETILVKASRGSALDKLVRHWTTAEVAPC